MTAEQDDAHPNEPTVDAEAIIARRRSFILAALGTATLATLGANAVACSCLTPLDASRIADTDAADALESSVRDSNVDADASSTDAQTVND